MTLCLVGNKADVVPHRRQVTTSEGQCLALECGVYLFFEVSCRTGSGFEQLIHTLVAKVRRVRRTICQLGL